MLMRIADIDVTESTTSEQLMTALAGKLHKRADLGCAEYFEVNADICGITTAVEIMVFKGPHIAHDENLAFPKFSLTGIYKHLENHLSYKNDIKQIKSAFESAGVNWGLLVEQIARRKGKILIKDGPYAGKHGPFNKEYSDPNEYFDCLSSILKSVTKPQGEEREIRIDENWVRKESVFISPSGLSVTLWMSAKKTDYGTGYVLYDGLIIKPTSE